MSHKVLANTAQEAVILALGAFIVGASGTAGGLMMWALWARI